MAAQADNGSALGGLIVLGVMFFTVYSCFFEEEEAPAPSVTSQASAVAPSPAETAQSELAAIGAASSGLASDVKGEAINSVNGMIEVGGGKKGPNAAAAAIINLNGHLCAKVIEVKPAGGSLYAVRCIENRNGTGLADYLVDGDRGTASVL